MKKKFTSLFLKNGPAKQSLKLCGFVITSLFSIPSFAQCPVNDQTVSPATGTFSCSGGSTTIDVGSSQAGVSYFLLNNSNGNAVVGAPVSGTGAGISFPTGSITSTTNYSIYGANPSNALMFTAAATQYATDVAPVGLPVGNVITVEAWIYPVSYPDANYNGVLTYGPRNCSPSGKSFVLSMTNQGRPSMATWCNDFVPNTGPVATLNAWNHIACVLDGNSVKLYLNGYMWESTLAITPSIVPGPLNIGCTDNPGRNFNGRIDEVRIWNTARTIDEIDQNKLTCLTGTEFGLVSYYKFEEGAGATLNDIGPANNDMNLINGPTWVSGSATCSPCFFTMTQTATVIVADLIAPTASNPSPYSVPCLADVLPPNVADVIDEADNCGGSIVVAFVSDVSDGNSCPEIITRTYSVTDADLNSINVTQTITINDIIMPTASNPAMINVQCIADVPAPDVLVVTDEADNCATPAVAFVSDISDGNTCPEIITRTYSVTDNCGNQILVTQLIVVSDITNPSASNPSTINVECIADVPSANVSVVTGEADNCSTPVVVFVSDVSDGLTCPETITRTYSVTDDCGNSVNVTQLIIVNDITNPTASNPTTINVECTGDIPAPDVLVVADEADNCSTPVVAFVSDVTDGLSNPETITRTYSVTDDCGNSINVTQQISVDDITAPVVSNCSSDITVNADAAGCSSNVIWTAPTGLDNCMGAITPSSTHNSGENFVLGITTVTYTFDDGNGNISTCVFDVEVINPVSATSSETMISCNGDTDGEIDLTPSGGTAPYSFIWTDGVAFSASSEDLTGLDNATYTVTITDNNGCDFVDTYIISEPTALGASGTSTDELLGNDGTIDLTVTGGTAPYTFVWTDGGTFNATTEDLSGLAAGTYDVTVTDANGCTTTTQVIVSSQVGIEESDNFSFTIYPNPTSGVFTLSVTGNEVNTIRILDASGRVVMHINGASNTTEIDLSDMQCGIYFVQIQNGTTVKNAQVILQ